jgi:hypothetical protein
MYFSLRFYRFIRAVLASQHGWAEQFAKPMPEKSLELCREYVDGAAKTEEVFSSIGTDGH